LSKVLKFIDITNVQPLRLGDFQEGKMDITDDNFYRKIRLPLQRVQEDEAKNLMENALKRANSLIESANRKAENILQKAMEHKAEIERKAFEKGYSEGCEQGYKKVKEKYENEWQDALKQFIQLRQELIDQNRQYKKFLEQECLKLSLYTAEKIVKKQLEENAECFSNLIEQAIEKIGEQPEVYIRVCENDYKKIDLPKIMSKVSDRIKKVNVIKDPTLSDGDIIIDGGHFKVDAGIRTRIENIVSVLKEMDVLRDV
jgi:flagellar assembly protein FliH